MAGRARRHPAPPKGTLIGCPVNRVHEAQSRRSCTPPRSQNPSIETAASMKRNTTAGAWLLRRSAAGSHSPPAHLPLRMAAGSTRTRGVDPADIHGLRSARTGSRRPAPAAAARAAPSAGAARSRTPACHRRTTTPANGLEAWDEVLRGNQEGMVAKDPASAYAPGHTLSWLMFFSWFLIPFGVLFVAWFLGWTAFHIGGA